MCSHTSTTKQSNKNQAYHLIQSFAKGEVSHEEAHRIGIELADKLLGGKYSYVVATHTDKGHPHNHIIFCAADNINHKKYNACKKSYYHIRQLSDELCKEHGLSIIEPSGGKGKKQERPVRGSFRNFGAGYTKEEITDQDTKEGYRHSCWCKQNTHRYLWRKIQKQPRSAALGFRQKPQNCRRQLCCVFTISTGTQRKHRNYKQYEFKHRLIFVGASHKYCYLHLVHTTFLFIDTINIQPLLNIIRKRRASRIMYR